MKKTLIVAALLAGAVSAYSQGQISFTGFNVATSPMNQQIWNTQASATVPVTYAADGIHSYTVTEVQGSDSASTKENPQGTTVYTAPALAGTGFDAQLLAGAGAGLQLSALSPIGGILNFYTQTAFAGFISGAAPETVGTTPGAPAATVAIAAWNNEGGTITSLAAAQAAGDPWGISALSTITTTFSPNPPAAMSTGSDLNLSFSLGTSVPEPSTIALGVMGASALLFRRRK